MSRIDTILGNLLWFMFGVMVGLGASMIFKIIMV